MTPIVHHWDGEQWTCLRCGHVSADPCDCECCDEQRLNGLMVLSTSKATFGMVVKAGVVVEAAPYGRRYWMGRHVIRNLRNADWSRQHGVDVMWIPDNPHHVTPGQAEPS